MSRLPYARRAAGRPVARTGTTAVGNPVPADIALSASSIAFGAASGTVVGVLSVTDPGESSWTFAITGGSTKFALSTTTGATVQLLRGLTGTLTAGVSESVQITVTDGGGGQRTESFVISVFDPTASFTMPIGLRNYGGSLVAANTPIQFGVPIDVARQMSPSAMTLTMTRDSDSAVIPVQMDLTSTSRVGGYLVYGVVTAKPGFSIAATTTVPCTLTITPTGSYSGGAAAVTLAQLNARDFKIEATGDGITGTGVAGFNSTDAASIRQIKIGAVECGWEGWSRIKVGATAQGQWGVRWRVMGKADTAVADWRVEAVIYCSDPDGSSFGVSPYGRSGTFVLKAGTTVLNNGGAFAGVFVSAMTGFKMYAGGDPILPAYGGGTLRPVHDRDYLAREKACYPYRWVNDPDGGWSDTYTPGSIGGFRSTWGNGGIDGTLGPMSAASYLMLRTTSDDTTWRRGYNAGLCQLSVSVHILDLATGLNRPAFGSYPGMAAADATRVTWTSTFNSSGVQVMVMEWGHYCDTAYVPAMLTGELAFVEGLRGAMTETAARNATYNCPQVSGRPRRNYPFLWQYGSGSTLSRYDDWPHRNALNFQYVADDGRADKAYNAARLAETAAFGVDLFVDFLAQVSSGPGDSSTSPIFDGVKDGSSTTNGWALALTQFSVENAYGVGNLGWTADAPWCTDYRALVLWIAAARNGEAYPRQVVESFFSRNIIGRAFGPGGCAAYAAAAFNPPAQKAPGYLILQNWTDYWQYSFNGTTTVSTRSSCPTTIATDETAKVEHKYVNVLNLLSRLGWTGAYGETYASSYTKINNTFGGGGTTWDETVGGRWVMAAPP